MKAAIIFVLIGTVLPLVLIYSAHITEKKGLKKANNITYIVFGLLLAYVMLICFPKTVITITVLLAIFYLYCRKNSKKAAIKKYIKK